MSLDQLYELWSEPPVNAAPGGAAGKETYFSWELEEKKMGEGEKEEVSGAGLGDPKQQISSISFKVEQDKLSKRQFVQGLRYLGSPSGQCPPCLLISRKQKTTLSNTGLSMAAICIFLVAIETFLHGMCVALVLFPLLLQAWVSTSRASCIHRDQVEDS